MAVPILWRNKQQRYSLEGDICPVCDRAVFPPRQLCPYCSREGSRQVQDSPSQASTLTMVLTAPEMNGYAPNGCVTNGTQHNGTQRGGEQKQEKEFSFVLPHRLELRGAGDD
jgi:hypothetical protein